MLSEYEALRACVRTQAEQQNALARVERAAEERVEAVSAQLRAAHEAAALLQENMEALRKECHELREKLQLQRRATASAEAAAVKKVADALAAETSRNARELSMLQEAARCDVAAAVAESTALLEATRLEHAAERASWEEQMEAGRAKMQQRAARHAARVREVITSEEECQRRFSFLEEQLRTCDDQRVKLESVVEERQREVRSSHQGTMILASELAQLDDALEARDSEYRLAHLEEARYVEMQAVMSEVERLRSQLHDVARSQKVWQESMVEKHKHEVKMRVKQEREVLSAAARSREIAREEEHRRQIAALEVALMTAREQHAAFEASLQTHGELLLKDL
ncbi:hypothetical protein AB1Y20_000930 [Prymnesium parvum]|uniref:Uncharacterized protein n=1 Tax=Prymnesium parvum TaxID=97485 RepID=A0AB34KBU6_PRYPA